MFARSNSRSRSAWAAKTKGLVIKVTVDSIACCAYGNCVIICPQIFSLPEGADVVHIASQWVDGIEELVEEAVRDCPSGALALQG